MPGYHMLAAISPMPRLLSYYAAAMLLSMPLLLAMPISRCCHAAFARGARQGLRQRDVLCAQCVRALLRMHNIARARRYAQVCYGA